MRCRLIPAGPRRLGAALLLSLAACSSGLAAAQPLIADVRIEGRLPFREARALRRWVRLEPGDSFDSTAVQAAAERLMDACHARRYPLARVQWEAEPLVEDESELRVRFHVEPGPRGRLHEVRFRGHDAKSASDLASVLRVRPRSDIRRRLFGRRALRINHLAEDRRALIAHYQGAGHIEAEIGEPVVEWVPAAGGFRVTWPVRHEGPLFRMGRLYVRGDESFPVVALAERFGLMPNEPVDPNRLQGIGDRIRRLYQAHGHAFAQVTAEPVWHTDEARLDLWIDIRPGTRPRLRSINLSGNTQTYDRVLLREIPLQPGDLFDPATIHSTQRRLDALNLFSEVNVDYQGSEDSPVFDLFVDVEERRTGRVEVGYEYGTEQKGAFILRVTDRNLAFRPPFRGGALQGEIGATVGPEIVRLDMSLNNPRFRNSLWGWGVGGRYEMNSFISTAYDQRSIGAHASVDRPIGHHHLLKLGYEWTRFEVIYDDVEEFGPIPGMESDIDLTSLWTGWTTQRVDRPVRPTRGFRFRGDVRLGSRWLGGDTDVTQAEIRSAAYFNPVWSHVASLRAGAGNVTPYGDTRQVPLPLRRHLGGTGNLRGFAYRSVSPLNDGGIPIGGESDWWASAEYTVPFFARLDVSAYLDAGDVSADAFGFSGVGPVMNWGIGLEVKADNFPVRFDLAFPLETMDGDRLNERGKARFSFSAGHIRW